MRIGKGRPYPPTSQHATSREDYPIPAYLSACLLSSYLLSKTERVDQQKVYGHEGEMEPPLPIFSFPFAVLLLSTLAFAPPCDAALEPDHEEAVPADFPKAFIAAMAVAVVCVVVAVTMVCVLAHCWQHMLLGSRRRGGSGKEGKNRDQGQNRGRKGRGWNWGWSWNRDWKWKGWGWVDGDDGMLVSQRWQEPVYQWTPQLVSRTSRKSKKKSVKGRLSMRRDTRERERQKQAQRRWDKRCTWGEIEGSASASASREGILRGWGR